MDKDFEKQLLGFDRKMSNLINEWDEVLLTDTQNKE